MKNKMASSSSSLSKSSSSLLFLVLVSLSMIPYIVCKPFNVTTLSFDEGYSTLFGEGNIVRSFDGKSVRLLLNEYTGSGFISSDLYQYGFFSAKIKLPSDYTAGVVVAFYMSNGDIFTKAHDELDFEFLGNIRGKKWRFQTNVYGNGSTSRGREERYNLWFDPSQEFHRYSILWTEKNVIFYVDEVPVREVIRSEAMGGDYPAKPMQLYATIWDASNWATSGGKYKVEYKYAPFVSEFSDLVLEGCPVDPIEQVATPDCSEKYDKIDAADYSEVTPERRMEMRRFRQRFMYYSYCYDSLRYPVAPPECVQIPSEKQRFKDTGRLKFGGSHPKQPKLRRSRHRSRGRSSPRVVAEDSQAEM